MTKTSKDKELVLSLKSECNNNCIFCQDKIPKSHEAPLSSLNYGIAQLKSVKYKIRLASYKGFNKIYFTGKEVLNHPNIVDLIIFARRYSFKRITLQTTGRNLADSSFLNELVKAGVSNFHIPIYGSNRKIHDAITKSPGSFNDLANALDNLSRLNMPTTLIAIFLKLNYKNTPSLIKLKIKKYLSMRFMLDHYRPHIESLVSYKQIMPQYKQSIGYLKEAVDIYKIKYSPSSDFFSFLAKQFVSIPFCIINKINKDVFRYLVFGLKREFLIKHLQGAISKDNSFKYATRGKASFCKKCIFNRLCLGPHSFYLKAYGQDEFKPIKNV